MTAPPLGDAANRSYADKLEAFDRFAEPEIRAAVERLGITPGNRILDAGCGVGLVTSWLAEANGPSGVTMGMDLSRPHLLAAGPRRATHLAQADIASDPLRPASLDLIWCCNTVNHVHDPVATLGRLRQALRPSGRLILAQSGLLPEMYFSWDAGLDERVRAACHAAYRDKYGLEEDTTSGVRRLVGFLHEAGLSLGPTKTYVIERTQPLADADRRYFQDVVFQGYWGDKVQPYLSDGDWRRLTALCDPASGDYCLDRPDFHHLQTLTVVEGRNDRAS